MKLGHFLILFTASLLVFISCQPDKKDFTALSAIPKNAAIVVEIHRLDKAQTFLESSSFLQSSLLLQDVSDISVLTKNVLKAINQESDKSKAKVYAFAHLAGANKYDWVICASEKELKSNFIFSDEWTMTKRAYASGEILTFAKEDISIYAIQHFGIIAASLNENLIEEIIRKTENNISIEDNTFFKEHEKLATTSDPLTVYVNFKEVSGISKLLLQNSKPDWLNHFGTWVELDASEENGNIILNGASINPDTSFTYLNCFKKTGSVKFTAPEIIPANAVAAVMLGTGDFQAYAKNTNTYLKHWNLYRSTKKKRDAIGIDIEQNLFPLIDNEFGLIYSEPKISVAESKMAYVKMKDIEKAMEMLINLSGEADENYREHLIFQLKREKLLPAAFGRAFKSLNTPYFAQHGDFIVFANSKLLLKTTINNYISNKTWVNSEGFQSVASQFSKSANIWTMVKNPGAFNLASMYMNDADKKAFVKNKTIFTEPDWAGIQITNKGEASLFSAYIGKQAEVAKSANQIWSIQLESPVKGKPQFVYNHSTKQNDIIVQDENNKLYWLNYKGEILWSTQVEGAVIGKIEQVDLFQNKKLQLAFTTNSKFYILDRLGRNVAPFPVNVKGEVTAPVAVMDYDKSRNYRFLVCAGTKVYMYNKEAKIVDGWQFTKAKADVIAKPKHYVLGGKDYIFIADSDGKINVLNRRGESRLKLNTPFSTHQHIYLNLGPSMAESRLASTDKQDHLTYLFLNDKTDEVEIDVDENLEHFVYDGTNMLFAGGNQLINKNIDFPFKKEFEENIIYEPSIHKASGATYFIATTENEQIHALNKSGNELAGFPVYGNTNATIGKFNTSGKTYLVGGTEDGTLFLYRIGEQ